MAGKSDMHLNCCQKTLAGCANGKIDEETAHRLGSYFGSGMHCGEVCGAVTGALMALGLSFGGDPEKTKISDKFLNEFKDKFGSILCRELKGEYKVPCPVIIEETIRMIKKIIER